MKTILIIVLLITTAVLWLLATSVSPKDDTAESNAFLFKSIAYWMAVILTFVIGYAVA